MIKTGIRTISKRYVAHSKLVIFILGIILISVITGFFGAFFSGIQERDYFVDSENSDIITILQPGVKTPSVSYVPASLKDVLYQIPGITSISPEVHSLVMINNKAANLHGISSTFFELETSTSIEGENLSYLFNSNNANVFIAGKTIASSFGLKVGYTYNIYSTTSESFSSFQLAGIVSFNSFLDDELYTEIINAQFFRPSSARTDYSMLRLQFDEQILSKDYLNYLLQNEFTIDLQLISQIPQSDYTSFKKISVFSSTGTIISEKNTDYNGFSSFQLPIGLYEVIIETNLGNEYSNLTVLGNLEKIIYVKDFILNQDDSNVEFYNLTIKSYYGNEIVSSVRLEVKPPFGNTFTIMNESISNLNQVPKGYYKINAYYNDMVIEKTVFLDGNIELLINFTYLVNFVILTPNNSKITDYSCLIYDYRTNSTLFHSNCPSSLYLEKSYYNITFIQSQLGTDSILFEVKEVETPQIITTILGNLTDTLKFVDTNNNSLSGLNISRRLYSETNFTYYGTTNSNGRIQFNSSYNSKWIIHVRSGNETSYFYFTPKLNSGNNSVFSPFKPYNLEILIYNGSDLSNKPLKNAFITIKTLSNELFTGFTDSLGKISIPFASEQIFDATVQYFSFRKTLTFSSLDTKSIDIALGTIDVYLTSESLIGLPLDNVKYEISSLNYNQVLYSSSKEPLLVSLPTGNEYNPELEEFLINNAYNLESFSDSFLQKYTYVIEISFQEKSFKLYIPKTYFSNQYIHLVQIPYTFVADIKIIDFIGKNLPDALVTLTLESYDIRHISISETNGIAYFDKLDPGYYDLEIRYQGLSFKEKILINSTIKTTIELPIVSANIKTSIWRFNLSAIDGKQYLDQFYSTSIAFFIQITSILFIIIMIVLVLLFSSSIKFVIETMLPEIAVLKILGASNNQIMFNTIYQLQLKAILASVFGILLGVGLTTFLPTFQNIQLLGFVIQPVFSLTMILFSLVIINGIIFFVLIHSLLKMNWNHPFELIREKNADISRI